MKSDLSSLGRNPNRLALEKLARSRNHPLDPTLEANQKQEERYIILQILGLTAFFCNFIFWYDDPRLSFFQSMILGIVFMIYLVYMVNHDIFRVLYVMTVYVSFQKVLAGDFGGMIPMLNMTNILLVTIIAGWWSRSFIRGEGVFKFHTPDFFIIVYTLLLTISMLRSEFKHDTGNALSVITNFKRVTEVFFVYFLFVNNIKTKTQIKYILFSVCCVMAAVGVMGVKQYYMDIGAGSWSNMDKNKITVLADQPNQLASFFCNYSFYLIAVFFAFWKRWWGVLAGILFIFCFQSVRVTFSRGGLLSFYAAALVTLVLVMRFRFILVLIPLLLVVFTVPEKVLGPRLYRTYAAYFNTGTQINTQYLPQQEGESSLDVSALSRLWIMQAGINRIREDTVSLFFGVGLGRFPIEIMGRHPKVFYVDAHNQWLLILVECGSIALVAFWCILAVCVWKAFYIYFYTQDPMYRAIAIGYLGGLTGLFIANFFGSRMNSNEITHFHWIMTAVLMRTDYFVRLEVAQRREGIRQARNEALGL